jgi:hypothetical protein
MSFKNELERQCFEIAERVLGCGITIEHNKTIQIETALFPEVASFKGPPAKEVDVLVAELLVQPKVVLLVSCKLLSRRAEPAHVQEWAAVIQTTLYFGLVVSPSGFTSGCEAWATSHNLGIVPPLKGRKLVFDEDAVFRMFERTLVALRARVRLRVDDLTAAPAFFDFVYRLVADFEGHQEAEVDGRYLLLPHKWASSFGEMYHEIAGRTVLDLLVGQGGTMARLSGDVVLQFSPAHVQFGHDPQMQQPAPQLTPVCRKNIEMESCALDFVRSIAVGKQITSAGDFGSYLEVGLDQRFNLGFHEDTFHLISTESPIEHHRL